MATCDVTAERRQDVMTSSVIRWHHYVCRRQTVTAERCNSTPRKLRLQCKTLFCTCWLPQNVNLTQKMWQETLYLLYINTEGPILCSSERSRHVFLGTVTWTERNFVPVRVHRTVAIVNLHLWSRINTFRFTFVYMATCDVTAERRKDVMTSSVIRWHHFVCRRQTVTAERCNSTPRK